MREGERDRESPKERKREPTPTWTGFYCFSWYITSRMVLIYYAQVHCSGLPFTDNKGEMLLITSKKRMFANESGKVVELVTLCTWEV